MGADVDAAGCRSRRAGRRALYQGCLSAMEEVQGTVYPPCQETARGMEATRHVSTKGKESVCWLIASLHRIMKTTFSLTKQQKKKSIQNKYKILMSDKEFIPIEEAIREVDREWPE